MLKLFIFCMLCSGLHAQSLPNANASYVIYKLANNIGTEDCSVTDSFLYKIYNISYRFNDRGIKRELSSRFKTDNDMHLFSYIANGFSARWVKEETNVQVVNQKNTFVFPIAKFAPATMQQLLINYWKNNNQPATISSLPGHLSVAITQEGYDTVLLNNNLVTLERLKIAGLIWGNEFAWMSKSGELIFLLTNDTEGDKTEIMNKNFEGSFASLLALSTRYAMQAASKQYPVSDTLYSDIIITGGNMINVNEKDSVTINSLVVIHDSKITYAGLMDASKIPANGITINAKGKYLLPGLWDMHAHLFQTEWLPKYIDEGVTTVRDCGNEFSFVNALQKAVTEYKIRGPKIIKAGLIDGIGKNALGAMQANTKSDAVTLVNKYKDSGFAQIKIYSSVKLPVLKAICDEAHKAGLTVTGHVPDGITTATAINAGMNMISHVSYFRNSILTSNGLLNYTDKRTRDIVHLLQNKNIVIDPTLSVYDASDSVFIKNIPYYKTVTSELRKAAIPIVAGTDMSAGGVAGELVRYVEAGFTPLQAIQSATIVPALAMKSDAISGSIAAGKNADIILLDGNPLLDITKLKKISTVIQGNRIYEKNK